MSKRVFAEITLIAGALACGYLAAGWRAVALADGAVYELRTYTALPGKFDAVKARFRDHTLKLFERHGIHNVGYWVPADGERSQDTLIYIVSHKSREAAAKSWAAFRADPDWIKARDASEKDGKIVAKVESVFLTPADFSPLK
jgi:hypothetical protein